MPPVGSFFDFLFRYAARAPVGDGGDRHKEIKPLTVELYLHGLVHFTGTDNIDAFDADGFSEMCGAGDQRDFSAKVAGRTGNGKTLQTA